MKFMHYTVNIIALSLMCVCEKSHMPLNQKDGLDLGVEDAGKCLFLYIEYINISC